jgi:hypothetical protein
VDHFARDTVPVFDDSDWPVFLVTQPERQLSLDAYRDFLMELTRRVTSRQEPFVLLVDASRSVKPDALRRKLIAETMRVTHQKHPSLMQGLGLVLGRQVEQGVVTALSWLVRPPYPLMVFETVSRAKVWGRTCVSRAIPSSRCNG